MSEEEKRAAEAKPDDRLDLATVQSTYKIIIALLDQVEASSSLISLMASMLGEEVTRKITETTPWASYLQSRRSLEALRPELERFVITATEIANRETQEEKHKEHEDLK